MLKWCFSTLGCTDRSFAEILNLAKKYSISALEVRGIGGELNNDAISDFSIENSSRTEEMMKVAKVKPLVLGTSVSFHDENRYEANLLEGKNSLKIASRLGFPYIRVFGNNIVGDEGKCVSQVAAGVRELCLAAQKKSITVLLEVHGDFNTIQRLLPIIEKCSDTDSFGIIWDVCHTHKIYGENWHLFYDSLAPYIRHVHLKDVKEDKQVLPGDGEIPITDIIEYMLNSGYNGYFSLEWEKHWRRELPEIELALDRLFMMF